MSIIVKPRLVRDDSYGWAKRLVLGGLEISLWRPGSSDCHDAQCECHTRAAGYIRVSEGGHFMDWPVDEEDCSDLIRELPRLVADVKAQKEGTT